MTNHRIILAVLLIGSLLLTGCSFLRSSSFQDMSWQKRQQELRKIKKWHLKGVLSVTYDGKRDIARFDWVQQGCNYNISINGPLNVGRANIIGDSGYVKLQQANGQVAQASTPEALTYQHFGWEFPVSNIRHWILSLPALGKVNAIKFDQHGHLIYLEQDGWRVRYHDFFVGEGKVDLPKIIELENNTLKIKIKILNSL